MPGRWRTGGRGSRLLGYPRTTFTGRRDQPAPGPHGLAGRPTCGVALLQAIDRSSLIGGLLAGQRPARGHADPAIVVGVRRRRPPRRSPTTRRPRRQRAQEGRLEEDRRRAGSAPNAKQPFADPARHPRRGIQSDGRRGGRGRRRRLARARVQGRPPDPDPEASSSTSTSRPARSTPRSSTSNVGLDPDLYPFYASTQTTTGGANITGIQVPALDKKLLAARKYASRAAPAGRVQGPPDLPRDGRIHASRCSSGPSRSCSATGSSDPRSGRSPIRVVGIGTC